MTPSRKPGVRPDRTPPAGRYRTANGVTATEAIRRGNTIGASTARSGSGREGAAHEATTTVASIAAAPPTPRMRTSGSVLTQVYILPRRSCAPDGNRTRLAR